MRFHVELRYNRKEKIIYLGNARLRYSICENDDNNIKLMDTKLQVQKHRTHKAQRQCQHSAIDYYRKIAECICHTFFMITKALRYISFIVVHLFSSVR